MASVSSTAAAEYDIRQNLSSDPERTKRLPRQAASSTASCWRDVHQPVTVLFYNPNLLAEGLVQAEHAQAAFTANFQKERSRCTNRTLPSAGQRRRPGFQFAETLLHIVVVIQRVDQLQERLCLLIHRNLAVATIAQNCEAPKRSTKARARWRSQPHSADHMALVT